MLERLFPILNSVALCVINHPRFISSGAFIYISISGHEEHSGSEFVLLIEHRLRKWKLLFILFVKWDGYDLLHVGGRLVSYRLLYLFDISKTHSAELHRIYILAMCSCPSGKLLKQVALPYTFADNHGKERGKLSEDAYSNKKRSAVARRGAYREINKIMQRMFKWNTPASVLCWWC